ncbi:MAG: hypothetical protein IJY67_06280 [Paludibacteraceae bacterium]|nr:hypothetical protein [Paludibacteraceae bacterium]
MKKILALFIISSFTLFCYAETTENRKVNRHEVRIGIGDCHYEAAHLEDGEMIHQDHINNHGIMHSGHLFAEYQYRINSWLGAGCTFDYMHNWQYRCGCNISCYNEPLFSSNISLIPTIRFTYFHDKMVNIYSAIGLGIHLFYNKGDDLQTNLNDNLGLALDICALGISIGNNHLFGAFEVGNMTTFTFPRMTFIGETLRMTKPNPFSKLLRISIGYRF